MRRCHALHQITHHTSRGRVIYPEGRDWRTSGIWFAGGDVEGATLAVLALDNAGMRAKMKPMRKHVIAPFAGPGGEA